MWVAMHKCMEAMLGISLHSYLYLKLAKMLCLSGFLFNKIVEEGRTCSAGKINGVGEEEGVGFKQCIHI
jgi:hypothetical protein